MPFAGEAVCLSAALLWAVAVAVFRGAVLEHSARTVNLAKLWLGAALQGLTVLALGQAQVLGAASGRALVLLALSGLIGLTLGDTALFGSVARIGVHRALLLQTLAPVFAAVFAWAWRNSLPSGLETLGAAVILCGVALVVAPRRGGPIPGAAARASTPVVAGLALGVLAAFGQGTGVVLAKEGMTEITFVPASFLRLATAAVGLALCEAARLRLHRLAHLLVAPIMLSRVVPATLLGTYVALFLMMLGIALVPAAVSATLLATSPVFGLLIDTFVYRQPLTARGVVGTLLAVVGVAVLSQG
jgi:drug/metabolite transporter (DMT)-like permease